jgi:thiol-disulfide isomerase/thioredoxin
MAFSPSNYLKNYFKKKKTFSIITDFLFIILLILLIIPGTRKEVSSFFIRMVSMPPSELSSENQFKINDQAVNWQFYDMQGNTISLSSLNDKPVFLNFWATWCPPCIGELPGIADLYADYEDKIHFVLVSNEHPDKVQAFAGKKGYEQLPFYIHTNTPADFASESIPATFLINKDGRVIISKKGAARWNSDKMKKIIDGLLQE